MDKHEILSGHRIVVFAVLLNSQQIQIFGIGLLSWNYTINADAENAQFVTFSPDCHKIAVGTGSSLSCWDIASQSSLYIINLPHNLRHISFSKDGKFITTNMGIVDNSTRRLELPRPRGLGDRLHLSGSWICCDKKQAIWLPPDYRPESWGFYDSTIVMGQKSGRVVFLDLDL